MLGFLFSPFGLAIITLIVVICVAGYILYSIRPIKQILLLRPRDKRGVQVPVVKETDATLECKEIGGVARTFIKAGCAWTFTIGRQVVTRFLGIEGTGYTAIIRNKIKETVSLEEALRSIWGSKFYDAVPVRQRNIVEKHKWGLTVEVEPIPVDDLMRQIPSDVIDEASENIILERFAGKMKTSATTQIYQFAMGAITGALLIFVAVTQGWLLI